MIDSEPRGQPLPTEETQGWGRFPRQRSRVFSPQSVDQLRAFLRGDSESSVAPRGLGRSYGDASLNEGGAAVAMTGLAGIHSFSPSTGIIDLDAGVSLDSLIRTTLPTGHFLSVTPGTRCVTIGGAIASDVHGKNHHRVGSFSTQVIDFDLVTAQGELLRCSREENPAVFWATVGGMGLTGFIVQARVQLRAVESSFVLVQYERAATLSETLAGLERGDREYEYTLAWLDLTAGGPRVGRSLLMFGRHATASELPSKWEPFAPPSGLRFSVPFPVPVAPKGPGLIGAFNAVYLAIHRAGSEEFVDFGRFFHPLDTVGEWNRLFGDRGFIECQFVVPNKAAEEVLTRAARAIRSAGRAPLLGVLKRFGEPSGGMLSFPRPGTTASLDLPVDHRLPGIVRALEEILLEHGGRVYLAKDAVQSPRLFSQGYPRLEEFRLVQRQVDPHRRL
ncbi:MAG: FAD-binding protein, partial [Candidatus Lutacidiplasmatales archaeon]